MTLDLQIQLYSMKPSVFHKKTYRDRVGRSASAALYWRGPVRNWLKMKNPAFSRPQPLSRTTLAG